MSSIIKRDAQLMLNVILDICRMQEINFSIDIEQKSKLYRIERSKREKSKKIRNLLVKKTHTLQVTI